MRIWAPAEVNVSTHKIGVEGNLALGYVQERFHSRDNSLSRHGTPEQSVAVTPEHVHQHALRLIVKVESKGKTGRVLFSRNGIQDMPAQYPAVGAGEKIAFFPHDLVDSDPELFPE